MPGPPLCGGGRVARRASGHGPAVGASFCRRRLRRVAGRPPRRPSWPVGGGGLGRNRAGIAGFPARAGLRSGHLGRLLARPASSPALRCPPRAPPMPATLAPAGVATGYGCLSAPQPHPWRACGSGGPPRPVPCPCPDRHPSSHSSHPSHSPPPRPAPRQCMS